MERERAEFVAQHNHHVTQIHNLREREAGLIEQRDRTLAVRSINEKTYPGYSSTNFAMPSLHIKNIVLQEKEGLELEQRRLLAEIECLRDQIGNQASGSNEGGSGKANPQKVSKTKECRVSMKKLRAVDENLNPARKKQNDDR